jgi:hypothetical protein
MMGDWNIGILGEIKKYLKPNIPLFQHSIIPAFYLSRGGSI